MKIVSIEPTPSPNSMKLNMDETLASGIRRTYTKDNKDRSPLYIQQLLDIPHVTSIYHTLDFIALDRHPRGDWQTILAAAREVFGSDSAATPEAEAADQDAWGEVKVLVQTFRNIPMQVRAIADGQQERIALPERFTQAATKAGLASPNLIRERKLEDYGVRYGELSEVLAEIASELEAAHDEATLARLVAEAEAMAPGETSAPAARQPIALHELEAAMQDADWRVRYAALERVQQPDESLLPLLELALGDAQTSIRRLAIVYLGDIGTEAALPLLYRAMRDSSAAVRRTAGDTLSDIGNPAASQVMADALSDANKLVRWRAARFLFEVGGDEALEALRAAQDEPEFEVRMQIKLALERIEGGEAAAGSVWQQMTNRNRS